MLWVCHVKILIDDECKPSVRIILFIGLMQNNPLYLQTHGRFSQQCCHYSPVLFHLRLREKRFMFDSMEPVIGVERRQELV